jgi:hypothetical protein
MTGCEAQVKLLWPRDLRCQCMCREVLQALQTATGRERMFAPLRRNRQLLCAASVCIVSVGDHGTRERLCCSVCAFRFRSLRIRLDVV